MTTIVNLMYWHRGRLGQILTILLQRMLHWVVSGTEEMNIEYWVLKLCEYEH